MEINRSLIRNIIRKLALLCLPFFAVSSAFSVSTLETDAYVQGLV